MKVEVKNFPKIYFASVRYVGNYHDCKPAWDTLMHWAQKRNVINQKTIFFGIGHDNPSEVKDCRYDACLSLEKEFDISLLDEEVSIRFFDETKCITLVHKGKYEDLRIPYRFLYEDESLRNYKINFNKPPREIYLNSPENTKSEDLLTEIYVPIE